MKSEKRGKLGKGKGRRKVLIFAVLFATLAFLILSVNVGCASAAEWHVYPGQSIQIAINNAGVGDTINVHAGTYTENVDVNKQLSLIGIGMPVVDAGFSGNVITLSADGITLDGFKATNSGGCPGVGIMVTSNNNTIIGNNASNNDYGIHLWHSTNNTITANTLSNNDWDGIHLDNSSSNTITNNTGDGNIILYYSSINTITGNNASNNKLYGIHLLSSSNNTITGNTASYNKYGIYLWSSSNNTITGNTASYNKYSGICHHYSSNNTITGNIASYNGNIGISLEHDSRNNTIVNNNASNNNGGISLQYSSNNTITGNTASYNDNYGISFYYSSNNTITNNTASYNDVFGIRLHGYSSNNTITGNTASYSGVYGYGIWLDDYSSNNTITGNNASNNCNGIRLYSSSNNTIINNIVSYNDMYGISLLRSSNNLIYNNYFNNTNNAYDDGNNIWNITKTQGTNIIGGPYLGGNYWSDYVGEDLDGDGLGDTLLPYKSSGGITTGGDYLPLVPVTKPTISIYTDKTSYTAGERMHLGLDVKNPLDSLQRVSLNIYLEMPTGGTFTLIDRTVTLPIGLDYCNPNFKVFRLPSIPAGTYTWHAKLSDPFTGEIISEDTAEWEFVSTRTPTEEITEVLEQTTVEIDFEEKT